MGKLELPRAIKFAEPRDVPKRENILKRIEERKRTEFIEGYVLIDMNASQNQSFTFYAEININNSRLWSLFLQLSELLPEVCSCLFGMVDDEEPQYGVYLEKTKVMDVLKSFEKELTQDCFLEFGLIYSTDTEVTEIYVPNTKYVKCWGVDKESFVRIMDKNSIQAKERMNFVDEFPRVTRSLTQFDRQAKSTDEVIKALAENFIEEEV